MGIACSCHIGGWDYTIIKTPERASRGGSVWTAELSAELTKFGWVLISQGKRVL